MTEIQKENKSMGNVPISAKQIPNVRFQGFESEWEMKNLGSLLEFKNGINASKEQYGKGVKFINVLDILNNDFIIYENIVGKVDVDKHTIEKFSVQYGDILFQRSSETREEVGTANVYLDKENTATFGGFVIRGRKIGNYDPIFFNKLLKTNSARDSITSKSGGSTRFNVGQETLSSINLYFPNISEQQKIASFLSLIDERIATQNKIIEELKVLKTTVAKKIFSRQLRFKDDNGNDFQDWEVKKLGDLGVFFSGGTPLTANKDYFNGDIPFIKSGEINSDRTEQYLSEEGLKNSSAKMVKIGDLIYALYGATSGEVGISKINGAINQAVLCMRTSINNIFLMNYLILQKESILKTYLQGGQGNLSAEIVKSLKVFVPNIEEQNRVANFLASIDTKIDIETQLLKKLEEQKKFLLQNLFV